MLRTEISDLDVKASKLDEDCEKKIGKIGATKRRTTN
jgi:hypothetical protein